MKTGADIVAAGATCPTGPTKYTAQTLDTLLAAIADGLTISQACKAATTGATGSRSLPRRWSSLGRTPEERHWRS